MELTRILGERPYNLETYYASSTWWSESGSENRWINNVAAKDMSWCAKLHLKVWPYENRKHGAEFLCYVVRKGKFHEATTGQEQRDSHWRGVSKNKRLIWWPVKAWFEDGSLSDPSGFRIAEDVGSRYERSCDPGAALGRRNLCCVDLCNCTKSPLLSQYFHVTVSWLHTHAPWAAPGISDVSVNIGEGEWETDRGLNSNSNCAVLHNYLLSFTSTKQVRKQKPTSIYLFFLLIFLFTFIHVRLNWIWRFACVVLGVFFKLFFKIRSAFFSASHKPKKFFRKYGQQLKTEIRP